MRGEAAVYRQGDGDHEARARAAQPQYRSGDLLRSTEASDRLLLHDPGHRVRLTGQHLLHHRRVDRAGADRVDADAARGIFDACASGHTDHRMLSEPPPLAWTGA